MFTALLPNTLVTIAPRIPGFGVAGLTEVQPVGLEPGVSPVKSVENITCAWLEEAARHATAMSEMRSFIGLILLACRLVTRIIPCRLSMRRFVRDYLCPAHALAPDISSKKFLALHLSLTADARKPTRFDSWTVLIIIKFPKEMQELSSQISQMIGTQKLV